MPKRRQTRADGRPRSGGQRPRGTSAGRPGSPGGPPAPAGRPGPADRPGQPGASESRQAVERFSARPLVFLTQLPRWVLLLIVLGLLISGFAVPGWIGAIALLVVGKLCPIHQQRLRVGTLQLDGAADETFDRIGDVVRLIEHVRRLQRADAAPLGVNQLIEN